MLPLLIDEGLPEQVAVALRAVGLEVRAVGERGAPPKGCADATNVEWCAQRGAILVTNDRGRKEPVILRLLAAKRVHAVFVYKALRAEPPRALARALLNAESKLDQLAGGRHLIHHKLRSHGGLEKR